MIGAVRLIFCIKQWPFPVLVFEAGKILRQHAAYMECFAATFHGALDCVEAVVLLTHPTTES